MLECTNMTIFMCVSMRLHECIKYSCLCVCVCVCVCVCLCTLSVFVDVFLRECSFRNGLSFYQTGNAVVVAVNIPFNYLSACFNYICMNTAC